MDGRPDPFCSGGGQAASQCLLSAQPSNVSALLDPEHDVGLLTCACAVSLGGKRVRAIFVLIFLSCRMSLCSVLVAVAMSIEMTVPMDQRGLLAD